VRKIGRMLGVLAATALAVAGLSACSASAATQPVRRAKATTQPVHLTKAQWQAAIADVPRPGPGCWHASYPELAWHAVKCVAAPKVPVG
jgi:hypothetical protein